MSDQNIKLLLLRYLEDNAFGGILSGGPGVTLTMQDNTLRRNLVSGMVLELGATATISGGLITLNGYYGILLARGGTATIGLDGAAELVVSHNVAAGLFVVADGSSARINSGRMRFDANGGGAIVGPVTDVFVDTDGDGLGDADEATRGTDARRPDTDGDGLPDGFEVRYGLAPLDPRDGLTDPDGDGRTNVQEQAAGTNPRQPDTDGDGLTDGDEVHVYGTDPTGRTPTGWPHGWRGGALYGTDPRNPDSDGDGVRDGSEVAAGSAPLNPHSVPTALLYGINALRNELLVLNPDTGQAISLGSPTGDPFFASGTPSQLFDLVWAPHSRTLYAYGFASDPLHGPQGQDRLLTLDPGHRRHSEHCSSHIGPPQRGSPFLDRSGGRRQWGGAGCGEFCQFQ